VQRGLDQSTLLLAYEVTARTTFRWAVRRDRVVADALDLPVEEIERRVDAVVGGCRRRETGDPGPGAVSDLSVVAELLTDDLLDGIDRLVVIPSGPLWYVPFEALRLPAGGMIVDRLVTSYAPSASVLAQLAAARGAPPRSSDEHEYVGFGVSTAVEGTAGARFAPSHGGTSTLQDAPRLVAAIARKFGDGKGIACPPDEATEWRVRTLSSAYRYVHFAGHSVLFDRDPLYSGLILAPPTAEEGVINPQLDDFLQGFEIFDLTLSAEVVLCSACETAEGRLQRGEGMVGMAQALFYAGARCVVLTLWPVRELLANGIAERFCEKLAEHHPAAVALHLAKTEARRDQPEAYADLASWAGFIAVGDA
jgi:CHAT domain-containing protein